MADTLGGLIDKLITVNLKIKHNQELFRSVRKLSFDEFYKQHINNNGAIKIWNEIQKQLNLEDQKLQLILEIEKIITNMINEHKAGKTLYNGKFIQIKHKTY